MTSAHTGYFISFEGIDGAGKSTHVDAFRNLMQERYPDKEVVMTREPGGTTLGEKLRTLLLDAPMNLETEALLMFAARREHLAQLIEPALEAGKIVISDRFTDASFAYQGGGRGLALAKLDALEQWVHPHLQPDVTFLFDVPLEAARARLDATRDLDKFEQEKADFFAAARNEYLRRAAQFPQRFRIIDSTRSIAEIQAELASLLDTVLAA